MKPEPHTKPETLLKTPAPENGETLLQFLDWLKTQPFSARTHEDFEAQIAEERNAWDD